jgi:hypothetical protein
MANTLKFGNGQWAIKEGSTLAYNDENNNFKPLPFNFERSTNATRVNKQGLIEVVGKNEPRIDYKDDSKGALLLEPERSNLVMYSQSFRVPGKNSLGSSSTLTIINGINPDATTNVNKLTGIGDNSSDLKFIVDITSLGFYTYSLYVRGTGTFDVKLQERGGSWTTYKVSSFTATNEWERIEITANVTSIVSGQLQVVIDKINSDDLQLFGSQLEQGSYATSYIPTQGSIVTREKDICSNNFSSSPTVPNTNTIVLKFIPMGIDGDFYELIRFSDGTNHFALEGSSTNSYDIYGSGLVLGGMITSSLLLNSGSVNTISFSYSGTSLKFSHNGNTINTNTTTGNLPTITEISHSVGALNPIKIIKLEVYNDFKTQEDLNILTRQ